jgi:phage head maturation protease
VFTKQLASVEVKAADQGIARAVFSRFHVVDHDGDWTEPGAFQDGTEVPVSAFGHSSWTGALPVGRATIRSDQEKAWADISFFLSTATGREHFETVRALGPLGAWSYGFDIEDEGVKDIGGQRVRVLRKLRVHEVSPVLEPAGIGTNTVDGSAKSDPLTAELALIRDALDWQLGRELAGIRDELERAS